jgi:hypothetical protein
MFITNFNLNSYNQSFALTILAIAGIALFISLYLLIIKKIEECLILAILFFSFFFVTFPFSLMHSYYKLTIAYVNINDNNETMTKDIAINTLLNDGIYPKYNIKYKTSKETFKITKEEYEKLSEIYYDDLNNRR